MISSGLMDNKEEIEVIADVESGVTDQMKEVPVVGPVVEESAVNDPSQAEPLPGDQDEVVGDDTTKTGP